MIVVTTGLILQELLQGFAGPRARKDIIDRVAALPFFSPDRQDHIDAAELRNRCRRAGIQVGAIDALIAQLCVRHKLTLLQTDNDFVRAASHSPSRVWNHLRVDAPLDALAIIGTRFAAPEDTRLEDWKRIARERALMMVGRPPYSQRC